MREGEIMKNITKTLWKPVVAGIMSMALIFGAAACGNSAKVETTPSAEIIDEEIIIAEETGEATAEATDAATEAATAEATEAATADTATDSAAAQTFDNVTIKVGATPTPHQEVLESIQSDLAAQGIILEIVPFTDYQLPNAALNDGSLDANYFQHKPFLDKYNEENKTDLISLGAIHYEPMGLYPGKTKTIAELQEKAVIVVPNDPSNEARALQLLADNGVIELKEGVGINATIRDITKNDKNIEFKEIDAAQVAMSLQDVDMAVINSNFALSSGLNPSTDPIASEKADSEAAKSYANVIAVRAADAERPELKALVDALKSDKTKALIVEKYQGAVLPMD